MSSSRGISAVHAAVTVAILAVIIACAAFLMYYGQPTPQPTPTGKVITDLIGRSVTIPEKLERVVVLTGAEAEIMCVLGLSDKIVGVGKYIPYNIYLPDEVKNKPVVGSLFAGVDLEAVMNLNPDLVIMQYGYGKSEEILKKFEELKVPVVCFQLKTVDDVVKSIQLLGKIFDVEDKANQLASFVDNTFSQIKEITSKIPDEEKPRVLMMSSIKGQEVTVYAKGSAWASLVEFAGAKNIAFEEEFTTPWPKVSIEKIITWNPDIIIVLAWTPSDLEKRVDTVLTDPQWQPIKAVKEGKVYGVLAGTKSFGAFLDWSPRLAVGAVQIAQIVQPKYFNVLNWKKLADQLLSEYYGMRFVRTVVDDQGRTVEIPYIVERIALLDGGMGEVIPALGAWHKVVAVTESSYANDLLSRYDPNITKIPAVAGPGMVTTKTLDLEALKAANPDVVILWSVYWDEITQSIEERGIPVINIWLRNISSIYRDIQLLGKVLGCQDRANELVKDLQHFFKLAFNRTSSIPRAERPKVMWVIWYRGPGEPFSIFGGNVIANEIITAAGGVNVAENVSKSWIQPTKEQILEWNPDVIVFRMYRFYNGTMEDFINDPFWDGIREHVNAFKNGRIYQLPSWSTWSPRVPLLALRLAMYLHPDLFQDIDFEEACNQFFTKWYGITYWS